MVEDGHVLVIGGANLDIKGRPVRKPVSGSSTAGRIRISPGGVARNIAENLAHLDVETILLTAVGDDDGGERILGQAAGAGIDISEALVVEKARTGAYMAILDEEGALKTAIDDNSILQTLTPEYFQEKSALFEAASLVAIDANLTPDSLASVVELCRAFEVPLHGDPTSTALAERLRPHLASFFMISPNALEAQALCGTPFDASDPDAALVAANKLVSMGVHAAFIALAEFGVIYATNETRGHVAALQTPIVDPTGAGDAMTAAIIFGLREEIPLDECVALGVTAAALTLRSSETVRSDLSIDLLYDELIV